MKSREKSLFVLVVLLRIAAVIVVIGGIGFSLWCLFGGGCGDWSRTYTVLGICGSLIIGLTIYSLGEIINLLLDVWSDVQGKVSEKS